MFKIVPKYYFLLYNITCKGVCMNYIFLGKIITTHGLKGEMKIKSNFKYKDKVFNIGNFLYLGKEKRKLEIISYRVHQNYDMVIFKEYDDISKIIPLKGMSLYFNKEDYVFSSYLDEELINLVCIYNNKEIGIVNDIIDAGSGNLLLVVNNKYIPKNDNFIDKVDINNKKIYFKNLEGLL